MTTDPICSWTGASGMSYTYYIRPRGCALAPNQMGNYIYAKKNSEGQWIAGLHWSGRSFGVRLTPTFAGLTGRYTCAHASDLHRGSASR
jgi:hypothetical protein